MGSENNNTAVIERLRAAGLRPTRQRLSLGRLLFDGVDRHVSAEQLHSEALAAKIPVSLATVYNNLHQFVAAGLLREVVVEPGRTVFDTNIDDHHHFHNVVTGVIQDIPGNDVAITGLPKPPEGRNVRFIEVIVRVGPVLT